MASRKSMMNVSQTSMIIEPSSTSMIVKCAAPLNRKDLSHYAPIKSLKITTGNTKLYAVPNGITDETLMVTSGKSHATIYRLTVTENKDYDVMLDSRNKLLFELIEVQTIYMDKQALLGCFNISNKYSSVTLPPRRLNYAVSFFASPVAYYFQYKETESDFVPQTVNLREDHTNILDYEEYKSVLTILQNGSAINQMAIQDDKYLACMLENQTIVIWDIKTSSKHCVFALTSPGVHLSWHINDPYKLYVVESNGWVKFFDVGRECCFTTFYLCYPRLCSGDWSWSNSLYGVAGWPGGMTTFKTTEANTNLLTNHEMPCKVFQSVKFNPEDNKSIATLEHSSHAGTLRLWRDHLPHHLWSYSNNQITDIAWLHGRPLIIALGHRHVFIFDGTSNS